MKVITLCLLVLVSASCLLSANANAAGPNDISLEDMMDLDELEAQMDGDYMDFEEYGFIRTVRKALKKVLKTVRGVNCTIKEVIEIMTAATNYVDAVDACGTAIPKDVLAVVNSCKTIVTMCDSIINLNSKLCNPDAAADADSDTDANSDKMSTKKCSWQLFKALMKLTRKINRTLKQIAKLPSDTSSCFMDATSSVKSSFNNFLPRIDTCVEQM